MTHFRLHQASVVERLDSAIQRLNNQDQKNNLKKERKKEYENTAEVANVCVRPFPRSKNSHLQNETKRKTFLVRMSFISLRIKKFIFISIASYLASL